MRILVAEDGKNMNRLISEAMKDETYSVDSCFDGREALDYALAADYDVIILDVNMPGWGHLLAPPLLYERHSLTEFSGSTSAERCKLS